MKLLFSIPLHENNQIVENIVQNIQKYVQEPIIVFHANQSFTDFDPTIVNKYKNVYVNPTRLNHTRMTSMLPILALNFHFAKDIDYDYYCIFHSNEMFVKSGIENYIGDNDFSYYYDTKIDTRRNNGIIQSSNILDYIKADRMYDSIVEGNFYSKSLFGKICEIFEQWPNVVNSSDGCIEESVIASLAISLSDKSVKSYMNLCKDHNGYGSGPTIDKIKEILTPDIFSEEQEGQMLPTNNIFTVKRIPRDINHPVRKFINSL